MRIALALLVLSSLSACAAPGPQRFERTRLAPQADPGKVIATEIAFARAARDDGQWTAFRRYAANAAIMYDGDGIRPAAEFLNGRADPERAVAWAPHHVWSSCDGSVAVTTGAWALDPVGGEFLTVWWRGADGEYRFIADGARVADEMPQAPAMIGADVASCNGTPGEPAAMATVLDRTAGGQSDDGTLHWRVGVEPGQEVALRIDLWNGTAFDAVVAQTHSVTP